MPQLILEYSSNIFEKKDLHSLLKKINAFLCEHLPTELFSCKSRTLESNTFVIGDGNENNALVHVHLKVMPGRTDKKLNDIGNAILVILKEYFSESAQRLNLQITLEIKELEKYFKYAQ